VRGFVFCASAARLRRRCFVRRAWQRAVLDALLDSLLDYFGRAC